MNPLTHYAKEEIRDARTGALLHLEDLWSGSPCFLLFLRRLGCPLCRSYAKLIEQIRETYELRGIGFACLSFEALGEGSDTDHSFEAGGYWKGGLYVIDKRVYQGLFGRKKLLDNFFGLLDMNKEALARSKETPGNFKGDGFQLGGQFLVAKGGSVLLEHRQKAFGDDAKISEIVALLDKLAH
jgi:prostamide/prostaglandin F2alpha synthase